MTVDTILRDSLAQGPLSVTSYHQNSHSTIRVVFFQQYSIDHRSHTPLQDEGDEPLMGLVKDCSPDIDTIPDVITEDKSTETDRCQR